MCGACSDDVCELQGAPHKIMWGGEQVTGCQMGPCAVSMQIGTASGFFSCITGTNRPGLS